MRELDVENKFCGDRNDDGGKLYFRRSFAGFTPSFRAGGISKRQTGTRRS